MKPYKRKFNSVEEAKDYFNSIGRLQFFGFVSEYTVNNFHHKDGRKYHMNIYNDARVGYEEMSPVVYDYWRKQEN